MLNEAFSTHPFEKVLAAYRRGEMIIIVDEADRENEGDLAIALDALTPEHYAFMMREGRALVCAVIDQERAKNLLLPLQVEENTSTFYTPFSVSIDHRDELPASASAASRTRTARALIHPDAQPENFASPGNVFPLIANSAGVIARGGHTEAVYDMSRLTGRDPSGVICEILDEEGTPARGAVLFEFAQKHNLLITSVADILRYRIEQEVLVQKTSEEWRETAFGSFHVHTFRDDVDGKEHLALVYGDLLARSPLVRLHSECLTGDVFGSRRCDCGAQLELALRHIQKDGCGVLIYLRQEGRGIGLAKKIEAYALQDQGLDTVDANIALGFKPDERDFRVAARILQSLSTKSIRLLTNNPEKIRRLEELGIQIEERVPSIAEDDECSRAYLETKRSRLGHLLG